MYTRRSILTVSPLALAAVVAPARVGADSVALAQTWLAYEPPGAGYRVDLPGRPEVLRSGADHLAHTIVAARFDGVDYRASHWRCRPVDRDKLAAELDAFRDEILEGLPMRVRSQQDLTIAGWPARQIVLETTTGVVVGVTRHMIAGALMIDLTAAGAPDVDSRPATRRFLESLTLTSD